MLIFQGVPSDIRIKTLVGLNQRLSTTQLMDVMKNPIFKDPYEPFARISGFKPLGM